MRTVGYCKSLSVAPGDTVTVMVNAAAHAKEEIGRSIVRLICADTRPDGAGFQEQPCRWQDQRHALSAYQPKEWETRCHPGSWAGVEGLPRLEEWTLSLYFMPTLHREEGVQTLVDFDPGDLTVILTGRGLELCRRKDYREIDRRLGEPLPVARCWHWLSLSVRGGSLRAHLRHLAVSIADRSAQTTREFDLSEPLPVPSRLNFAARRTHIGGGGPFGSCGQGFNGRIELPWLAGVRIDPDEAWAMSQDPAALADDGRIVAAWDFSREIGTDRMIDVSPHARHGRLHNHPTRAVRGVRWDGTEHNWTRAPHHYGAAHFHDDDLTDAGWPATYEWTVPAGTPSGIYAAKLEAADGTDYVPFFVRPGRDDARQAVAFLVPTATYLAYANNRFPMYAAEIEGRKLSVKDAFLRDHPEIGWSLYERHADGSGVHHSSHLRPIMDLKPNDHPWGFPADTNITAWLHHLGVGFDVVTDEDLHREGADLLAPYRVVVTGTHPEYASTRMLDGLEGYLARGGRLMYMGGNGFYWRIAYDPQNPAVIELRRAEGRGLAWDCEPGEYYHAFGGEYGGLWRNIGRPPNRLVGVGFVALAGEGGTGYRRTGAAEDPRAAFIFEGTTEGAAFGGYGSICGGVVSQEIDRWNPLRGSPAHAMVVASSFDHPGDFVLTREEAAGAFPAGDTPRLRADMTFFETSAGGAVFSTGSIGFAGALAHNGYDNDVCRVAANVLRRFADPAPFACPDAP